MLSKIFFFKNLFKPIVKLAVEKGTLQVVEMKEEFNISAAGCKHAC